MVAVCFKNDVYSIEIHCAAVSMTRIVESPLGVYYHCVHIEQGMYFTHTIIMCPSHSKYYLWVAVQLFMSA